MLVSADEKFGADALLEDDEPPAALPEDVPEDSVELPLVEGEAEGLVVGEEEDCAKANVENANNTAAVVVPIALSMLDASCGGKRHRDSSQAACRGSCRGRKEADLAPRTRIERATCPLGGGCSIH